LLDIFGLTAAAMWGGLITFIMVRASREIKGKTNTETGCYITSAPTGASKTACTERPT